MTRLPRFAALALPLLVAAAAPDSVETEIGPD